MTGNHKVFSNKGNTLQARYRGQYKVSKRVGDLDYVIETPDG